MVTVVVRTALLTVVAVTVAGVVAAVIHAVAHILAYLIPALEIQCTRTARRTRPVPLRSAEAGERQLMTVVDALADIGEVTVSAIASALDITVTPCLGEEHGDSPSALHQTG